MKKQIKKSDLNKHISITIRTRRVEEFEVSRKQWDEVVRPLLRDGYGIMLKMKGYKHLEDDLLFVKKGLADLLDTFPDAANYGYNARQLSNKLSSYADGAMKELLTSFYSSMRSQADRGETEFEELAAFPVEHRQQAIAELNAYTQLHDKAKHVAARLDILCKEAYFVVKSAKSGKDGMEKLKALGFPMDAFKETDELLPAIQQFSVDTCILVDNCK